MEVGHLSVEAQNPIWGLKVKREMVEGLTSCHDHMGVSRIYKLKVNSCFPLYPYHDCLFRKL